MGGVPMTAPEKPALTPEQQQRADWAYGNAKLSNPDVTREMCEEAVRKKDDEKPAETSEESRESEE